MRTSSVARNYAGALLELAERDGNRGKFATWITEIGRMYAQEPAFRQFLTAPGVPMEEKKSVLRNVFEGRAPEVFIRFLHVVLDRRRQGALPGIAQAYRDLVDDEEGRVRAEITLPFEADEAVRTEVVKALERRFSKTVAPEFRTNPEILGGLIVRVGDELFDASLRSQLERMRRELHGRRRA